MPQYNKVLDQIDKGINGFVKNLPLVERRTYRRLLDIVSELELSSGNIKTNLQNIKIISRIKREMEDIILSDKYLNSVKDFTETFSKVELLQNNYFAELSDKFKPKKVYSELKKVNINTTIDLLTENGLGSEYTDGITKILNDNIKGNGKFSDMVETMRDYIVGVDGENGSLVQYAKQISTDAINQYSANLTQAVSNDLGLNWFQYIGSNKDTTRPFCLAMTAKRYFHRSEIPQIIEGNIDGKKVSKAGLDENTSQGNFQTLRGGYNCRHQIYPVAAVLVPKALREKFPD